MKIVYTIFIIYKKNPLNTLGSQPFSSAHPLGTFRTFHVTPDYKFPNPQTPTIIICSRVLCKGRRDYLMPSEWPFSQRRDGHINVMNGCYLDSSNGCR